MAYTPTTWTTGDTITASAMNKLENGVANAGGASWDAVIRLTHANNSNADSPASLTPSIVEGTFSDLFSKISNGEYPTILVEYTHPWGNRFAVPMAYITYASPDTISMSIAGYSAMSSTFIKYGDLAWSSSDNLTW